MEQTVFIYTKKNCLLCDDALMYLKTLQHLHSFNVTIRDINEKAEWLEKYQLTIPVIETNDQQLLGNEITLSNLEQFLSNYL